MNEPLSTTWSRQTLVPVLLRADHVPMLCPGPTVWPPILTAYLSCQMPTHSVPLTAASGSGPWGNTPWWQGSDVTGRIGMFPKNYVELSSEVAESHPIVKALFDFETDHPGDLLFVENDEIVVMREISPDWWRGR